ncbi:MAG: hypothetical protein ABI723_19900 [Bacteroidia bacterium]
MRTININISDNEFDKYGFKTNEINFSDFLDKIRNEVAREALRKCQEIAEREGLSEMSMDEINAEIKKVRDAKNRN